MPRKIEVPEVTWNKHAGCWQLRFSHNGVRFQPTFGRDESRRGKTEAQKRAAIYYADVVSGRMKIDADDYGKLPFVQLYADFLAERASEIDPETLKGYATYGKHFARVFSLLGDLTEEGVGLYQRKRLGEVKIATLRKELAKLGQFARWACDEKRYIEKAPKFPRISPKAGGTKYKKRRREGATPVTPEQIEAIIALLPEWSRSRLGQQPFPVRDRFVVLWETGLRPDSTVGKLEARRHYRKGEPWLHITEDIDKNKWARKLPVTERAMAALDRCWPASGKGLLFGQHDFRHHVQAAAETVLPAELAARFTAYDLRHARVTLWCATQAHNLGGIAFLVGDDINTLRKYCHPDEHQALSVLGYAAGYTRENTEGAGDE
jgi:integrase